MSRSNKNPDDKDVMICPKCDHRFRHRSPYMYARRRVDDVPMQIIDTWNVPYSTGLYVLARDEVPVGAVEEFAKEKAHFPFWPLVYLGKLYAKETWDD